MDADGPAGMPPAPGETPVVLMFSRRACGLCDEARAIVEAERRRTDFRFQETFVDGDDRLEAEYGLRVPVVLVDGVERFEFVIEPSRLSALLRAPS